MTIGPRLEFRQSQTLVMTPQLQQAIKLLQLTNIEISAYVEQELEQNPLLERGDTDMGDTQPSDDVRSEPDTGEETPPRETLDTAETLNHTAETGQDIDRGESMDVDVDNTWNSDSPGDAPSPAETGGGYENYGAGGGSYTGEDLPGLEQTLAGEASTRDTLLRELGLLVRTQGDRLIGANLIDMLNEQGYVQGGLDEVAQRLGCEREDVEAVLGVLQTIDPPGLFARDLAECLALQLQARCRLDPVMRIFLDHLDLLAKRDVKGLMKVCGVDVEDIQDMVAEIRTLDPRPGSVFAKDVAQPVIPDVIMRPGPDGGWLVELNAETLPRVLVNNTYMAEVSAGVLKETDKRYLQNCLQSANWLVKSLHQRATTILKVATELVRQQDGFFRKGVSALRPLVLRDVADVIDMHESTVSRVTSNKFIATPRGLFELKYFFTSSVGGSGGEEGHSSEAVRQRLKELVNAEDPKKVLSDDKLMTILKAEGIDVARRTVAKYRDSLGIPSSVQRRREKMSRL